LTPWSWLTYWRTSSDRGGRRNYILTKVVAINGSPNMDKGSTAKILGPFLDGMREAGASVELFYAKQLDVKPCTGEGRCSMGQCYIDDNMQSLYPKLRDADILVLATPVYIPLPGEMQNLLNRLLPLDDFDSSFRDHEDRSRTKLRSDVKISKVVLVSSGGGWEMGNFGTVLRIAEEKAKNWNVEFSGALLRPHAGSLTEDNPKTEEVLDAARQAGHQLIAEGKISKDLLGVVSQPLTTEPMWWKPTSHLRTDLS
jgi:multimeric flavodoxin WrbA